MQRRSEPLELLPAEHVALLTLKAAMVVRKVPTDALERWQRETVAMLMEAGTRAGRGEESASNASR